MNCTLPLVATVGSLCLAATAFAVEPRTEHTFQLAEGEARPAATLADAHWLVGSWSGSAFGQTFEEEWSKPSAGSMIGTFKLLDGDDVSFIELLMLNVEDGTLSLKVRHFNADFSAWEEKDEFVNFRLVSFSDDELHFGGLSFYRRDEDNIDAYIVMKNGDEVQEEELTYRRR